MNYQSICERATSTGLQDCIMERVSISISRHPVEAIRSSRLSELEQHHANMRHSHERIRHNVLTQLPSLEEHETASNDLTILHTFSHLLIREICMISGYSSGSITERLYLTHQTNGSINNCGILLYTSGPSSDGLSVDLFDKPPLKDWN